MNRFMPGHRKSAVVATNQMRILPVTALLLSFILFSCDNSRIEETAEDNVASPDTTNETSTLNRKAQIAAADSIKIFTVDDYPVTDEMLEANSGKKESGEMVSFDKAWFSNDTLNETLVFELYTDNHRMVTYHFLNNDIPPALIQQMELHVNGGQLATDQQKQSYIKGFIDQAKPVEQPLLTTKKGFRLGDSKDKAIKDYGPPDSISTVDGVERWEWSFVGDAFYDGKTDLKGKAVAKNSFGHQAIMFFRDNRIIAIILYNAIP